MWSCPVPPSGPAPETTRTAVQQRAHCSTGLSPSSGFASKQACREPSVGIVQGPTTFPGQATKGDSRREAKRPKPCPLSPQQQEWSRPPVTLHLPDPSSVASFVFLFLNQEGHVPVEVVYQFKPSSWIHLLLGPHTWLELHPRARLSAKCWRQMPTLCGPFLPNILSTQRGGSSAKGHSGSGLGRHSQPVPGNSSKGKEDGGAGMVRGDRHGKRRLWGKAGVRNAFCT